MIRAFAASAALSTAASGKRKGRRFNSIVLSRESHMERIGPGETKRHLPVPVSLTTDGNAVDENPDGKPIGQKKTSQRTVYAPKPRARFGRESAMVEVLGEGNDANNVPTGEFGDPHPSPAKMRGKTQVTEGNSGAKRKAKTSGGRSKTQSGRSIWDSKT